MAVSDLFGTFSARRGSLGTELAHIQEEDGNSDDENNNSGSQNEKLLPSSIRLPPIFENQGHKLTKRDFSSKPVPQDSTQLDVNDAMKYRYLRPPISEGKGRKMSM